MDVASGLNIAAFSLSIAFAAWAGGLIVSHWGLQHTPLIGFVVLLLSHWRPLNEAAGLFDMLDRPISAKPFQRLSASVKTALTSNARTARCELACRVVWQGRFQEWRLPMPIFLQFGNTLARSR